MPGYDLLSRTLTVSEANEIIHDTVESLFYELSIEGEISGFRPASSGHWYFTLKDKGAALDAAVFRSAQYSMVMPDDGDLVIAKGSLSFYAKTGKLTFIVREMKKKGEGDLLQIIEKRKEYYRSLGYFDEDRKKPIPEEINTLGVVTSPTGAAIRDILNITRRRAPSLNILLFPHCTGRWCGGKHCDANQGGKQLQRMRCAYRRTRRRQYRGPLLLFGARGHRSCA